ncbi:prepilin-type N-terminal cleavage/methylation domain-containing protein, partial [Candidatus Kaiserbacteria bacterium]|nr:prepilin-type N-terminal cleavage/methylation domain-containing protein [Candidatus Kaiserbacteria bacterium]
FRSQQEGFSLVETLVAITILLIVVVGPMKIIISASNSTSFSGEQVVAFFLAQEGAEIAQKARDDLVLKKYIPDIAPNVHDPEYIEKPWDDFTDTSGTYRRCFESNGCRMELNSDSNVGGLKSADSCVAGSDNKCLLYIANTPGKRSRYTYDVNSGTNPNTKTPYTRVVSFDATGLPAGQLKVTSKVTWRTGSLKDVQQVEVVTYLFDVYGS